MTCKRSCNKLNRALFPTRMCPLGWMLFLLPIVFIFVADWAVVHCCHESELDACPGLPPARWASNQTVDLFVSIAWWRWGVMETERVRLAAQQTSGKALIGANQWITESVIDSHVNTNWTVWSPVRQTNRYQLGQVDCVCAVDCQQSIDHLVLRSSAFKFAPDLVPRHEFICRLPPRPDKTHYTDCYLLAS